MTRRRARHSFCLKNQLTIFIQWSYELWRKFKKVQTLNKEKKRPILRVKRHRKKNSTALKSNARLQSINRSFVEKTSNIGIFFPKLFCHSVRKKCSGNWSIRGWRRRILFFFFLQSQKKIFIRWKVGTIFGTECLFLKVSQILYIRKIKKLLRFRKCRKGYKRIDLKKEKILPFLEEVINSGIKVSNVFYQK